MKIAPIYRFFLLLICISCHQGEQENRREMFAGQKLYRDVSQYASFGVHRTGSPGDSLTTAWIAEELSKAGFEIELQPIALNQYIVEEASIKLDDTLQLFPHWWWPEDLTSINLKSKLVRVDSSIADYQGATVFVPFKTNPTVAYLQKEFMELLSRLDEKNAGLVIVSLEDVSDEIYMFNVQMDTRLPLPVLVSRPGDTELIEKWCQAKELASIKIRGRYENRISQNVVASRLIGDPDQELTVISTPTTGWFNCVGERGPGIAIFLAFARWVDQNNVEGNYRLIASTGHELTHIGADHYLNTSPPPVESTRLWVHLGASLMVHEFEQDGHSWARTDRGNRMKKVFNSSEDLSFMFEKYFQGLGFFTIPGRTVGEVNNVKDFGYRSYLGFGGKHHFFHTPKDGIETVSAELLDALGEMFGEVFVELCLEEDRVKSSQK